jgi:probable F420-dependent oxidoreductase
MKFGLSLFGLGPRHYPEIAAVAEANGFESVWMPEHLVLPAQMPSTYLYTSSGQPPITPETAMYDPWVILGAISQATSTIRLATNVFILPLRHPLQTARTVVTLDRLSRGRVTLGVGVGWLEEEFAAVSQDFHNRGARTNEIIGLLRRLWTEEVIEQHGEYYSFEPVKFEPKPVQHGGIPIEIGGNSTAALERAGRIGDGWIEIGAGSFQRIKEMLAVVEKARRESDRLHLPFEVTTSHAETVGDILRCQEMGVTRISRGPTPNTSILGDPTLKSARLSPDDFRDWIKRFADEVISRC